MNKILPGLYIGNFKDARDAEQLSKNKVTHILSVHDSARPMLEGVKYLCIPAADSPSQNLTRHFKESIKFIHECRLRGESCLVHWCVCLALACFGRLGFLSSVFLCVNNGFTSQQFAVNSRSHMRAPCVQCCVLVTVAFC